MESDTILNGILALLVEPWPEILDNSRARFERRATDRFVREHARKLPLSVSTDRIAYCAMRCAVILGELAQHIDVSQLARDGSGMVVEAFPGAALRCWLPAVWTNGRENSYKGAGEPARDRRERLVAALLPARRGSRRSRLRPDRESALRAVGSSATTRSSSLSAHRR
jgi:hypothetical protein